MRSVRSFSLAGAMSSSGDAAESILDDNPAVLTIPGPT